MGWGLVSGVSTAVLIILFVAIFIWAYRPQRKRRFEEAAQLALDEQDRNISVEEMEQHK